MLQVLPVQSVAVGSEKQSWIVFKPVVREVQVVPSHLAANTNRNKILHWSSLICPTCQESGKVGGSSVSSCNRMMRGRGRGRGAGVTSAGRSCGVRHTAGQGGDLPGQTGGAPVHI